MPESSLGQARDLAGECLSAIAVLDTSLLPDFRPGDRLLPVSCAQRRPRFGEFVVVSAPDREASLHVARFVALFPRRRPRWLLTWRGRRYEHQPAEGLRGRILSAQRDGRSWDLGLPRRWRFMAPFLVPLHRALAALQCSFEARSRHRPGGVGRSVGNT